jgi:hypothetical protein
MHQTEGNMKECQFTNKVEEWLEPQDSAGHGSTETFFHDITQIINDETVWTVGNYVAFVNRNRERCNDVTEGGKNPLRYTCEKVWEGKYRKHEQNIKRKYW